MCNGDRFGHRSKYSTRLQNRPSSRRLRSTASPGGSSSGWWNASRCTSWDRPSSRSRLNPRCRTPPCGGYGTIWVTYRMRMKCATARYTGTPVKSADLLKKMPGPLRVALLGGGKMAHQHAAAIRQCRDAKLVAVVDPHVAADALKAGFGADVETFADARQMLAEIHPDVVHVVTPPASHVTLARQCLEAGANVYVEKPFALTSADAESILRLAEAK